MVDVVLVLLALLSVVEQPAQKAATVSKANIAKVLRIDFSPVTREGLLVGELSGAFVKACAL